MQYLYGEKNILRALDEAEFWMHQEAEHTQVIRALTPDLEEAYVDKLQEFEDSFNELYGFLVRLVESAIRSQEKPDDRLRKIMLECVSYCIGQCKDFIKLLNKLLSESKAVHKSRASQTVIHHISRESQYFIGIDQLILNT